MLVNFHFSWRYNQKIYFRVLIMIVVLTKQENVHPQTKNSKMLLAWERKVIKIRKTKKVIIIT